MNVPLIKNSRLLSGACGPLLMEITNSAGTKAGEQGRAITLMSRCFGNTPLIVKMLMLGLLVASGQLYAEDADQALFINSDGKVTIQGSLEAKTITAVSVSVQGSLEAKAITAVSVSGNGAGLTGLTAQQIPDLDASKITGGGLSLLSTKANGAFINLQSEGGLTNITQSSVNGLQFWNKTSKDKNLAFLFTNADQNMLLTVQANGNVGIGKTPEQKLDVAGAIQATSVNGEKPPMIFEVGQKGDTTKWHAVNQDIKQLCGDADGCTMKFLLRVNSTDEVRAIDEQIYIEQPDKSGNKTLGLSGWTRQRGGENTSFVLQTAAKHELVPYPWEWIYVRNYSDGNAGPASAAFTGYNVQFMTRPNVSATVIIYDR